MPPLPRWYRGDEAIAAFLAEYPLPRALAPRPDARQRAGGGRAATCWDPERETLPGGRPRRPDPPGHADRRGHGVPCAVGVPALRRPPGADDARRSSAASGCRTRCPRSGDRTGARRAGSRASRRSRSPAAIRRAGSSASTPRRSRARPSSRGIAARRTRCSSSGPGAPARRRRAARPGRRLRARRRCRARGRAGVRHGRVRHLGDRRPRRAPALPRLGACSTSRPTCSTRPPEWRAGVRPRGREPHRPVAARPAAGGGDRRRRRAWSARGGTLLVIATARDPDGRRLRTAVAAHARRGRGVRGGRPAAGADRGHSRREPAGVRRWRAEFHSRRRCGMIAGGRDRIRRGSG